MSYYEWLFAICATVGTFGSCLFVVIASYALYKLFRGE